MAFRPLLLIVIAFALGMIMASQVRGDDFRVETEVFVDSEETAAVETLTIFSEAVIYDFVLGENEQITVFDVQGGRIVLLDTERQLKTTLTTDKLLQFIAHIKARGVQGSDAALFDPVFTAEYDETTHELTLSSEQLTYRVTGQQPKDPEAAKRYQLFADWYARLNAVSPPNLPPFGRIALNQALADKGLIPEKIERTSAKDLHQSVRSEHTTYWILSNTDRRRIARAGRLMASYRDVSLPEFWQTRPAVADGR